MHPADPQSDPQWLDAQYNARARVPEHGAIFERWRADSRAARQSMRCTIDVAYGDAPGEALDLFPPDGAAGDGAPVLMFIHGGYWRSLDKADHSFIAPPFVARGALVVLPNYALCPQVGIETIALQMSRALAWVHRHAHEHGGDPRRLVVAGHSAGGHLAAMLLACDGRRVAPDLPARPCTRALSISGLFELEPVRLTPYLADLRLTPQSVRRLSPARFSPPHGATLHAVVGGAESEEFRRQNRLIAERWGPEVVPVCEEIAGRHHFSVLDDLVDPAGRIQGLAAGLLGLRQNDPQLL